MRVDPEPDSGNEVDSEPEPKWKSKRVWVVESDSDDVNDTTTSDVSKGYINNSSYSDYILSPLPKHVIPPISKETSKAWESLRDRLFPLHVPIVASDEIIETQRASFQVPAKHSRQKADYLQTVQLGESQEVGF